MRSAPEPQAPRFHPPSPPPGPVAQAQPVRLPALETPQNRGSQNRRAGRHTRRDRGRPKAGAAGETEAHLRGCRLGAARTANPNSAIPLPKDVVPDAIPKATGARRWGDLRRAMSADSSLMTPNSIHAPSPGESKSNLQLLSDPRGVDFKPYMIQVLMAVRRNWLAIPAGKRAPGAAAAA